MASMPWYLRKQDGSVDCTCDVLDKDKSIEHYVFTMLDRTSTMFEWSGLPDTIPAYMLEFYLQVYGHCAIVDVGGELYALAGAPGGAPDPYYRPTMYVVANPALNMAGGNYRILNHLKPYAEPVYKGDCVLIKCDTQMRGLLYMFSRYASELTENDISIRCAQINSRMQALICAGTDPEIASAQEYLDGIVAGKLGVVAEKQFLDGVKAANISVQGANNIIQLIELQQYLKASWFNEIGLNSNYNMKREYLSEEELRSSSDALLPLIDDMLSNREECASLVNSTFGTNITVKKNSAWENKQAELDTEQKLKENEAEAAGEGNNGTSDSE